MDSNFLKFWGNLLLNAAEGQRQMEEINQWISQGLNGYDDLTNTFLTFYGFGKKAEDPPPDSDVMATLSKAFLDSYREYSKLMGLVPKTEYQELLEKYEELKKKSAQQEEAIEHLRGLLRDKIFDPSNTLENFQELIHTQADQFQRLIQDFNKAMGGADKDAGK